MIYTITGEPIAKGRPRFTKAGHTYTPKKTRDAEKKIVALLKTQKPIKHEKNKPIEVEIRFFYPHRKSFTKKDKMLIKKGMKYRTQKPDVDNLVKLVLDSANGILWHDDSQIVKLTASKHYEQDEAGLGRTEIIVKEKEK